MAVRWKTQIISTSFLQFFILAMLTIQATQATCVGMSIKVEAVTEPISLGEGPHWDIPSQTLYFIDIRKGSVHSYNPETNKHFTAVIGDGTLPVSLIVPVEGQKEKFVISIKNELATITWDGKSSTTSKPEKIASFETSLPENRINDGKCDTEGRLWAGTMGSRGQDGTFAPVGAFYSFSKNNNIKKHLVNITCSNGLTWSVDNKKLYHIDSFKYCVDSYEYDAETETLSNKKTIFDFKENNLPGIPDGMTIDTNGILYVANYDGCQVLLIEPETGKLISKIPIPATQVTSVAFGGPNLDELYVTSANLDPVTDLASSERNGTCGCLFKVTNLCAKGLPMTNIKL